MTTREAEHAPPDPQALKEAIESALGRSVSELRLGSGDQRLYSTVWNLSVHTGEEQLDFLLKQAGERADRQTRLSRQAFELSSDSPYVVIPETFHLKDLGMLLVRQFRGRPLSDLCTLRLPTSPVTWFRHLSDALSLAGAWLSHYHRSTRGSDREQGALLRYLQSRQRGLEVLSSSTRDRLLHCCRRGLVGDTVTTHGDFTPWNVLVAARSIGVIDFGIEEWIRMSPYWDVASMIAGLRVQILFSWRSPARWNRVLAKRLIHSFSSAYDSDFQGHPDFKLCTAVRHFSFFCGQIESSSSFARRTDWHEAELEKALFE